jgi:hypothetical protein
MMGDCAEASEDAGVEHDAVNEAEHAAPAQYCAVFAGRPLH